MEVTEEPWLGCGLWLASNLGVVFERFTDRARSVLILAQEEARLLSHSFIGTEHLLLGMIHEGEGVAAKALEALGVELEPVRERVRETIQMPVNSTEAGVPFTPRAKKVLELALREALQLGHSYIGTEHLLLGLVREGQGVGIQVLQDLGAEPSRVRQQVIQRLAGYENTVVQKPIWATATEPSSHTAGLCPGCRAELRDVLRYSSMAVAPTSPDSPPLTVEAVFCGLCGATLGMFKQDPPE
jgi:ATP-dependent Clp protease ATP-binding subunit ClpA